MNIIVCIKQVPETTEVKINPETNTLIREGVKSIINPFDMYAIEEAIRIKEKFGGKSTVITMGPPQAESALREAIAMGIDEGVLISDRAFAGSDTWATSYILSSVIKKIGDFDSSTSSLGSARDDPERVSFDFAQDTRPELIEGRVKRVEGPLTVNPEQSRRIDLILCGKQASDGDTAQVGPGISMHLDIPQVTYVKKIEEIKPKDRVARVERMTEEGFEIIQTVLPALFTVVKEINEPRLPTLKGMIRSKQAKITVWTQKELNLDNQKVGLAGSPTQVVKIFTPPPRIGGQILEGESREVVEKLTGLLKSEIN